MKLSYTQCIVIMNTPIVHMTAQCNAYENNVVGIQHVKTLDDQYSLCYR